METALQAACKASQAGAIQLLLEYGADWKIDDGKCSILHMAVEQVRFLLYSFISDPPCTQIFILFFKLVYLIN